jgi:hypothetical protein
MFHPDILEGTLLVSFLLSLLTKICFNYTIMSPFYHFVPERMEEDFVCL